MANNRNVMRCLCCRLGNEPGWYGFNLRSNERSMQYRHSVRNALCSDLNRY